MQYNSFARSNGIIPTPNLHETTMRATAFLGVVLLLLVVIHNSCGAHLRPRARMVRRPYQRQRESPSRPSSATVTAAPGRTTFVSSRHSARPVAITPRDQHQQQRQATRKENLLKREYKVSVLPKPKPGYYYNSHVEKPGLIKIKGFNADANEKKHEEEVPYIGGLRSGSSIGRAISEPLVPMKVEADDDRVFFENNRFWRVSSKPKLKPGFYLNQQFQNKSPPAFDRKVFAPSKNRYEKVTFRVDSDTETKYHEVPPTARRMGPVVSRVLNTAAPAAPQEEPASRGPVLSHSALYEPRKVNPSFDTAFVPIPVAHASTQLSGTRRPSAQKVDHPSASTPNRASRTKSRPSLRRRTQPTPQPASRPTPLSKTQASPQASPKLAVTTSVAAPAPATASAPVLSANVPFSCEGLESGYYPDEASNCKEYHICNPVQFGNGKVINYKHDFTCSPGTTWDQSRSVCMADHVAASCSQSVALAFS